MVWIFDIDQSPKKRRRNHRGRRCRGRGRSCREQEQRHMLCENSQESTTLLWDSNIDTRSQPPTLCNSSSPTCSHPPTLCDSDSDSHDSPLKILAASPNSASCKVNSGMCTDSNILTTITATNDNLSMKISMKEKIDVQVHNVSMDIVHKCIVNNDISKCLPWILAKWQW